MAVFAKILSLVEIGILLVAASCGIIGSIMISLNLNQFGNQCILNAGVKDNGGNQITIQYSGISRCNYCLAIQVVALFLALAFGAYRLLVLCKGKYDIKVLGRFIVSIVFGALTFFMFVGACLVSLGMKTFCSNLLAVYPTTTGCRTFQESLTWFSDEDGSKFYDYMKTVEGVSWVGVLMWLSLTVLCIVSVFLFKRQRP